MPINKNELTKEMIEKAMQCKTVDELIALAKTEGFEITNEEAEAYMAELADIELDGVKLKNVAGGGKVGLLCGWLRIADARKLIHSLTVLLQILM